MTNITTILMMMLMTLFAGTFDKIPDDDYASCGAINTHEVFSSNMLDSPTEAKASRLDDLVFEKCMLLDDKTEISATHHAAELLKSIKKDISRQEKKGCTVSAISTPVVYDGDVIPTVIEIQIKVDGEVYLDCIIENVEEGYSINYKTGVVKEDD